MNIGRNDTVESSRFPGEYRLRKLPLEGPCRPVLYVRWGWTKG